MNTSLDDLRKKYLKKALAKSDQRSRFSKPLEVKKYPEVQTWLKTVSPSTRPNYLRALKMFCEFAGKTPSELIKIRDNEVRNSDPSSRTLIRDLVLDFRAYLEKEVCS
jgi:hypothetical protein